VSRMTEDDIIFDDVYELCEVISRCVFAVFCSVVLCACLSSSLCC